jgi:hypothetical protein
MAFHAVRFPLDVALGARGGPERATDVVTMASGREERNSRWAHARRRYNAGYGVKSRADMLAVLDYSSNGTPTPTALDQAIGVGDGVEVSFSLTKRYGASFDPYLRPITRPVAGSVVVAVAGVGLATADFSVDALTGVVTLDVAPGVGAAVTVGFLFDVPVRFDTDRLDVELTSFDAAEAPSIPLIEVRE